MAQHRPAPGREYGSHEPAIVADAGMAHRVHPPVQRVQAAAGETMANGSRSDPDLEQLGARDHAVLAFGQRSDRGVGAALTGFGPHKGVKPVSMSHGA